MKPFKRHEPAALPCDKDGWRNNTGTMPVDRGTLVDVVYQDGHEEHGIPAGYGSFDIVMSDFKHPEWRIAKDWSIDGVPGDIVKWRLTYRTKDDS